MPVEHVIHTTWQIHRQTSFLCIAKEWSDTPELVLPCHDVDFFLEVPPCSGPCLWPQHFDSHQHGVCVCTPVQYIGFSQPVTHVYSFTQVDLGSRSENSIRDASTPQPGGIRGTPLTLHRTPKGMSLTNLEFFHLMVTRF